MIKDGWKYRKRYKENSFHEICVQKIQLILFMQVDSIWVDLSQGLNLIKSGSISMSMISKLWTVNSTSFCPILEFMAEAAFSNPEYYQVDFYISLFHD